MDLSPGPLNMKKYLSMQDQGSSRMVLKPHMLGKQKSIAGRLLEGQKFRVDQANLNKEVL